MATCVIADELLGRPYIQVGSIYEFSKHQFKEDSTYGGSKQVRLLFELPIVGEIGIFREGEFVEAFSIPPTAYLMGGSSVLAMGRSFPTQFLILLVIGSLIGNLLLLSKYIFP
jgi:hypothetical protein